VRRALTTLLATLAIAAVPVAPAAAQTPLPPNYNPAAGATVIAPVIDCDHDVQNLAGELPAGIIIDDPDTTIINPQIRDCATGIQVQSKAGVAPSNVRIIADAAHPGYVDTILTHNRAGIRIKRGTGVEIGDVSAPAEQIGGEFYIEDSYKYFEGNGGTDVRVHHTTGAMGPTPSIFSPQTEPGAFWGYKWLADRTLGMPREVSRARFDHNDVSGFDDEGISFDSRGNTATLRSNAYNGTVKKVTPGTDKVTLTGDAATTAENLVGLWIIFNEGGAKAASLQITARSSGTFTVADPTNKLGSVGVGNRVTVGMRFHQNQIDHNRVDPTDAKTGIDFHGSTLYSRIEANHVVGTPTFAYGTPFHYRTLTAPQCIDVRSMAGPQVPAFSFYNSVVDNHCEGSGDISATVISWGTYEVDSPTWMAGNSFSGTPTGQEWRYKAPQPAADPWVAP
jgi:hypothetical protein